MAEEDDDGWIDDSDVFDDPPLKCDECGGPFYPINNSDYCDECVRKRSLPE